MTYRERLRAVFRGERRDRNPYLHGGGPLKSTMEAWKKQGLSDEQADKFFESFLHWDGGIPVGDFDFRPMPEFEEKVLEEDGNKRIWIDSYGVKRLDAIKQPTPGFATRRYLEFPVRDETTWKEMKWRYEAKNPARTNPNIVVESHISDADPDRGRRPNKGLYWKDRVELCNSGDRAVEIAIPGIYWTVRDWCGFEGLSMMFYDHPKVVHEMMEYWADFLMGMLDEPFSAIKVEYLVLNEDMAFKNAAMLSPEAMREFMLPHYKRLYRFFKDRGAECVCMDSDGYVGEVLDVFYPDAIDGLVPVEIAAGNDPEIFLEKHKGLFLLGGIDKRELRFTKEQARAEIAKRYRVARKYPTYLPGIDHGTPPDVPLRNYLYMNELIKGFADGEDIDTYEPPCELEKQLGPIEEMFDPLRTPYACAEGH